MTQLCPNGAVCGCSLSSSGAAPQASGPSVVSCCLSHLLGDLAPACLQPPPCQPSHPHFQITFPRVLCACSSLRLSALSSLLPASPHHAQGSRPPDLSPEPPADSRNTLHDCILPSAHVTSYWCFPFPPRTTSSVGAGTLSAFALHCLLSAQGTVGSQQSWEEGGSLLVEALA